jgi:hypothetical protein
MPAAWDCCRTVSTSHSSAGEAGLSMTRAPIIRFAIHLDSAREMKEPPMPKTAQKTSSAR